ncbi:hypothetical protein [Paracoccus lutimaris]|uniref:Uncharacterized protein n=1 Tax=Paracoccus lutimaris TaxID=1490030 RepID=A0A368ZAV1_9RHOB|nr:hypothetical protein [Paracoccus lutimaris]RCW88327.1 hypothetical protein DFP89_102257 [Paracoccus lutimaris]
MQHEMMRQPAPTHGSDNVGDVLASIRRLIAQDETPSPIIPNQMLNTLPRGIVAAPADEAPADEAPEDGASAEAVSAQDALDTAPEPTLAEVEVAPLILDTSALIAPDFTDLSEDRPEIGSDDSPDDSVRLHLEPIADPVDSADQEAEPLAEPAETQDVNPWQQAMTGTGFDPRLIWADPPQVDRNPTTLAEDDALRADITEPTTIASPSNAAQSEETMLHANASVTPINPQIEAQIHAEIEPPRDSGEPHLFAPQDKDAQKGTHLRGMIREAIRQELQGEIGTRLSRNLQQMIRHEIELTLRQMCEQE